VQLNSIKLRGAESIPNHSTFDTYKRSVVKVIRLIF